MYLTIKKNRGKEYLQMMESYLDPETGKAKKRLVKSYGRYDSLPDDVRQAYEDSRARKLLTSQLEKTCRNEILTGAVRAAVADTSDDKENTTDEPKCGDLPKLNSVFSLRYGHLALKPLWEDELGLKYKIGYLQKAYTDIDSWSLNDLIFYLSCVKIICPQSYLQSSNNRSDFIYCPWSDVNQDNFYRALDFVYDHKDELLKHAVKTHIKRRGKGIRLAFFDCTNTWFETPYDDVTWRAIRFAQKTREELEKRGATTDEINDFMESLEYQQALQEELEFWESSDIRMRGMSKEGRFAQPLISIALAIDEEGFPIDCRIFAGNISEIHLVEPTLNSLQEKYGIKDFYFVADRGINGTEVLSKVQEKNIGFVVAQKVSQQKEEVRSEMLDLEGYVNYLPGDDGAFVSNAGTKELDVDAPRLKVCDYIKTTRVKESVDPQTGKAKSRTVKVKCKIVYTFSPQRRARDLAQLEEMKKKANKAISERALIGSTQSGWRSIVETKRSQATSKAHGKSAASKEEKENYRAIGLKHDVIKNKEEFAGYAAVIFDHPQNEDFEKLSDVEVLDTYHKLVGIEENFRAMKSSFSIRPMHVRLHQRIEAHCYLCVFALMMLRIMQGRLLEQGIRMSSQRICDALADAKVVAAALDKHNIYFTNVRSNSGFYAPENTGKGRLEEGLNDLVVKQEVFNNFVQNKRLMRGDTQAVLDAAGLGEVPMHVSLKELKRILKINPYPDSKVLSYEHYEMMKFASN